MPTSKNIKNAEPASIAAVAEARLCLALPFFASGLTFLTSLAAQLPLRSIRLVRRRTHPSCPAGWSVSLFSNQ
jgi:hypothetical protein